MNARDRSGTKQNAGQMFTSVRQPGSLFLHQVQQFTQNPSPENAEGIPAAFFLTMFPAGLIPEGEQKRDSPEYRLGKSNMGNKEALNDFENQYPEYREKCSKMTL